MVIEFVLFFLGIFLLIKCADWIVDGASSLANRLGVSTLVIGLTVVAFGTSLPELTVGILSSIGGAGAIVFGNILGANIANILLLIGITAIISDFSLKTGVIWKQIPFVLLSSFILFLFCGGLLKMGGKSELNFIHGIIFLSLLLYFFYSLSERVKSEKVKPRSILLDFDLATSISRLLEASASKIRRLKTDIASFDWKSLVKMIVGFIGIYFGGKLVVDGTIFIATQLGFSSFLISATLLSLGTTLPELTVCVFASIRKKVDLAIGNVLGSVIFNILGVLGISALIHPIAIPPFVLIDIAIMFFSALLLFVLMFIGRKHGMKRSSGILFLSLYILYIAFLIIRG